MATAPAHAETPAPEAEIRSLIADMEAAWNRGDFEGYMRGFLNPGVVFVSRGQFQRDWQGTLDHYVRDYGGSPEKRGTLHFYDIKVEMLAPDAAQLISRYHLDRAESPQYGINTRLMRKVGGAMGDRAQPCLVERDARSERPGRSAPPIKILPAPGTGRISWSLRRLTPCGCRSSPWCRTHQP